MHYVSGVNNAGYLPELSPNVWETFDEAKEDLRMMILEDADYHDEVGETSIGTALARLAEGVKLWDRCAVISRNGREYWIKALNPRNPHA